MQEEFSNHYVGRYKWEDITSSPIMSTLEEKTISAIIG